MKKFLSHFLAIAALATLTACGGGASAPTATTPPIDSTPPAAGKSTLVHSVAAPTYMAGSEELAAFTLLNTERERCGFGMVAQHTALDTAARGNADYMLLNNKRGHYQDPATPGFTGVMPDDRAIAAGYTNPGWPGVQDESAYDYAGPSKAGYGTAALRGLLGAPYHVRGLLSSSRDIGLSVRSSAEVGVTDMRRLFQSDLSYNTVVGDQEMADADVQTYPCAGSTAIGFALTTENPSPVPGRDLIAQPLGSVVYIALRKNRTLVITSASMINVATGAAVALRTPVTGANDPNTGYYTASEGYVIADVPMLSNTSYQATVNGTNNGTAFTRSFTFTTGS